MAEAGNDPYRAQPVWGSDEKGAPMVVVSPPGGGSTAAAVTRTAGSIMMILLMVAAVVFAVGSFFMQMLYKGQLDVELKANPRVREVVAYRDNLEQLNREIRQRSPLAEGTTMQAALVAIPDLQREIDQIRLDNADLRRVKQKERETTSANGGGGGRAPRRAP